MENPFEILEQRMISMENKIEDLLSAIESGTGISIQRKEAATRAQAAKYLSVSVSTIDNLARSGQLKSFRLGSSVRFTHSDLDDFINSSRK